MNHSTRKLCWSSAFRRLGERMRMAFVRFPGRLKAGLQRIAVALVFFGVTSVETRLQADDKLDPKQPWWVRAKIVLDPKIEKELAAVADKMEPLRRKDIEEHMQEVIDELLKTTGITDEAKKKAIEAAGAAAVNDTMKPWKQAVTETNRVRLNTTNPERAIGLIKNWPFEGIAVSRLVLGCKLPDEQPSWSAALKATLSADQLAKWEKVAAERHKKRDEEVAALLKQWDDNQREGATMMMEQRVSELSLEMKIDKERQKKLREAATAIVDRICKAELDHAAECLRFEVAKRRAETSARGRGTFNGYYMDLFPFEDPAWQQALNSIVTPAEMLAWKKHEDEEKAKFEKQLPLLLKPALDQMTTMWKAGLEVETGSLVTTLSLSAERAKALEPVVKAALDRAEKTYTRLAKEQIDKLDATSRARVIKQGRYYVGIDDNDLPQNDPEFKAALQNALTPEEKKQLEAANDARKARRMNALGRILISELDKKVAFTAKQREKLQPIAERVLKNVEELSPAYRSRYNYDFEPGKFFAAATSATDTELKAILDPAQLAHWREACDSAKSDPRYNRRSYNPPPVEAKARGPERPKEPEEVEIQLSEHMSKRSLVEKKRVLLEMTLQAEDAVRVAALPAETSAHLRTAARGAVERVLAQWKSNTDRNVRSNIQGVTPGNVKQRLASMDDYYYSNRGDSNGASTQLVWKKTVERELNDAQRAAWKVETDARKDFANSAIIAAVLAEFDRRQSLTSDQWNKLEPLITGIVKEYSVDIEEYFSNSTPWYLETYSSLIPFAGVPEKDLKAILSKPQWDRWSGDDSGNASNYWENLQQNHKNRVGRPK